MSVTHAVFTLAERLPTPISSLMGPQASDAIDTLRSLATNPTLGTDAAQAIKRIEAAQPRP